MKSCTVLSYYKQYKQTLPLFSQLLKVQEQTCSSGHWKAIHACNITSGLHFKTKPPSARLAEEDVLVRCASLMQNASGDLSSPAPLRSGRWSSRMISALTGSRKHPSGMHNFCRTQTPIVNFVILPKQRDQVFFQHSHKAV